MKAQDQALRTNAVKVTIEKEGSAICRKSKDETVGHLVSECSKLAKINTEQGITKLHWSLR